MGHNNGPLHLPPTNAMPGVVWHRSSRLALPSNLVRRSVLRLWSRLGTTCVRRSVLGDWDHPRLSRVVSAWSTAFRQVRVGDFWCRFTSWCRWRDDHGTRLSCIWRSLLIDWSHRGANCVRWSILGVWSAHGATCIRRSVLLASSHRGATCFRWSVLGDWYAHGATCVRRSV